MSGSRICWELVADLVAHLELLTQIDPTFEPVLIEATKLADAAYEEPDLGTLLEAQDRVSQCFEQAQPSVTTITFDHETTPASLLRRIEMIWERKKHVAMSQSALAAVAVHLEELTNNGS